MLTKLDQLNTPIFWRELKGIYGSDKAIAIEFKPYTVIGGVGDMYVFENEEWVLKSIDDLQNLEFKEGIYCDDSKGGGCIFYQNPNYFYDNRDLALVKGIRNENKGDSEFDYGVFVNIFKGKYVDYCIRLSTAMLEMVLRRVFEVKVL